MKFITIIITMIVFTLPIYSQVDSVGIYVINGESTSHLYPLKFIQQKTNTLGTALSYGIASTKMKSVYAGASAKVSIKENGVFLFYFPVELPLAKVQSYFMFSAAYTPNDFIVCKLKSKKNKRELETGKVNIYAGATTGVNIDDNLATNIIELRNGVYQVSFSQLPEDGEYCFVFTGASGAGGYMPIFDFSINTGKKKVNNTWN